MNFKSKTFYIRITGDYALWTAPETKGGGEKMSYPVPTKQSLTGIADACYWKPTIKNIVEEVKVINPIRTSTAGFRALIGGGKVDKADLNYITYLRDVEYLMKYHFIWDLNREDLKQDRNPKKHEAIAERSLKRGGRRPVFLGASECMGFVEQITDKEYENEKSHYDGEQMSFGLQFHSFIYPKKPGEKLISLFANTKMIDGIVTFQAQEDCEVRNELSNYQFKFPEQYRSVDDELKDYN